MSRHLLCRKAGFNLGMRDTLLALGYQPDGIAVVGFKEEHNAGNDAVRVLAVLLGLLALPLSTDLKLGPLLEIEHHMKRRREKVNNGSGLLLKKYWISKPEPAELFPYMAKLRPKGMPIYPRFGVNSLFNCFSEYKPIASGISREDACYYLCLPTLESLERFILEVDGQASEKLRVAWSVTLAHDKPVIPIVGKKDLVESMRLRKHSEETQVRRLQREEKRKLENYLDGLDGGLSWEDHDIEDT